MPQLDTDSLGVLAEASASLAVLSDEDRNATNLALKWWRDGTDRSGAEGFVYRWVAIEVIGMPDTTNIRPLNESLARIYGIDNAEARERFLIGRCQDLRSRIVHGGQRPAVNAEVLDYLDAVFLDLLFDRLRLTSRFHASARLSETVRNFLSLAR